MTEKLATGVERNSLPDESAGVATSITVYTGTITIIDTPGKPLSAEINIDVSTAVGKKIWKSITLSPANKNIKLWAAGIMSITFKPYVKGAIKRRRIDSEKKD